MTWLDVGNGWRNLFLLSCAVQALALGCLFCAHGWFVKGSRFACFWTGAAVTPLCQYLWMLGMGFVWPHAPRVLLIAAPPALAALALLGMAMRRLRSFRALWQRSVSFARRVLRFDKPALVSLCFALCLVILLAPPLIRFMSSMDMVNNGDAGEYLALAQRYCEDRDMSKLLEKNETDGHFRGHSHFPSLELYMSYGLMHTGGQVGYPNDKACFTGLGMLVFYAAAAYGALLCIFCRQRKRWMLLGVLLFNLTPDLYHSVAGAPRDVWRILALLWAVCLFAGLKPDGGWKRYLGKLALCFVSCFTVMSTHVVCFVVLPFIVAAWVVWRWLENRMTQSGGAWRTLLRSLGLALAGAAGTVTAFLGNLWCFRTWGQMSPWRLMSTFTEAPWYDLYLQMEYKAEETSTHLHFFQSIDAILRTYITSLGAWALGLSAVAFTAGVIWTIFIRARKRRETLRLAADISHGEGPVALLWRNSRAQTVSLLTGCALMVLFTLAPMTGLLDTRLYSFSGSFLKMSRYTLQWFLLGNVLICAALAAAGDWLEKIRLKPGWQSLCRRLPAWVCAALCVLAFVQGVRQTGYSNSLYRYSRNVMEDEGILLDNPFQNRFGLLMDVAAQVPEGETVLVPSPAYQYALRGEAYLIPSNSVASILNLPLDQMAQELANRKVALVATDPDFWDKRYFALSTLNDYLETLPPEQIMETEAMRLYLLDESLAPVAREALEKRRQAQP